MITQLIIFRRNKIMSKEFKFVSITTENNPNLGYLGYYCSERVTLDDIIWSDDIPVDIKVDPHIYEIRKSDDGRRKATIEPSVIVNFDGCFITSKNIFGSMKYIKDKYLNILKFRYETPTLESKNRKVKVKKKNKHPRINTGISYDIYYMVYLTHSNENIRHEAHVYTLNAIHNNLVLKCRDEYTNSQIVLSDSESYPDIPMFVKYKDTTTSVIAICHGKESNIEDSYLMKIVAKVISSIRHDYNVKISFAALEADELFAHVNKSISNIKPVKHEPIIAPVTIDPNKYLTTTVENACVSIINAYNTYHEFTADEIGEIRDGVISAINDAYEHGYNALSIPCAKIKITTSGDKQQPKRKIGILAHFIIAVWSLNILSGPGDWNRLSECMIEDCDESEENIPDEENIENGRGE